MKPSSDYPRWELHPRKLTESEAADPNLVIQSFFDYASLPQVREQLWLFLETMVTGSFNKDCSKEERIELLYFFQQLEKLIEAAHVIRGM
jgi:hypothetical protein